MTITAAEKMVRARTKLVLYQPFFGALALGMVFEQNPSIPTMRIDGKLLEYNRAFVNSLPEPQVQGCMAHEIMHVANLHHLRQGAREPKEWNESTDYAINSIILRMGFELPKGALVNPAWDGKSAEEIYAIRRQQKSGGGGQKPPPQSPPGPQSQKSAPGAKQSPPMPGQSPPQPGAGRPDPNAPPSSDPGGCGEVQKLRGKDGAPATESERQQGETDIRVAVVQAAQAARARGKGSADIDRLVEKYVHPKLPWSTLLRDYMDRNTNNDYSWSRPNPRYISQGVYLPMLNSKAMGHVVIAVDTSGSIGQSEIEEFNAEIGAIFDELKPAKVDVIYCDDEVKRVDTFEHGDEFEMHAIGGGGTSFKPPFEHVNSQGDTPQCLIYVTDLCGDFPEDPGYPVLWVVKGGATNAPFGEVIAME